MNILKGYVFRLYPDKNQEQLINKTIGCSRFIYNYFLDDKIKEYKETGKSKSAYDQMKLIPLLSKEKEWLKEVDSCSLRNSLLDLERAFKNFYNGSGFPKFKAKGVHERYKTNNIKSSYKGNHYETIKIDLGIKDLIVTSYNEKIENTIKINNKKLIGLHRGLARCKAGSKNRYKMRLKIQRMYQKIRNARKHMIHDITNKLIKENDIIVTENLDVKSMQKNHYVAKGLNENSVSEIIRVLKYKANWNNKKLIQINRYYPSSQICNVCNYQNKEVKDLSIRKWECPVCYTNHDRDYNASVNIMFEGLKIYMKGIKQFV